tara:strand:+ start:1273 stop:1668 length:396 start_codon:yes stop_codon:yes gene_type:complete
MNPWVLDNLYIALRQRTESDLSSGTDIVISLSDLERYGYNHYTQDDFFDDIYERIDGRRFEDFENNLPRFEHEGLTDDYLLYILNTLEQFPRYIEKIKECLDRLRNKLPPRYEDISDSPPPYNMIPPPLYV